MAERNMTTNSTIFPNLSDDDLLAVVKQLAADERRATAALIRSLIEIDARRLYLREGCSSLFTWCVQVLGLDEGAAYNRIEVARAARRFPELLARLDDGSLTLTAARLLAPHLTQDDCHEVLAAAHGKTKRDVERLVASLVPKPDVRGIVRRMPERQPETTVGSTLSNLAVEASQEASPVPMVPALAFATPPLVSRSSAHASANQPERRSAAIPIAPGRFRLQLTISEATHDKWRRVQDLMRHAVPSRISKPFSIEP